MIKTDEQLADDFLQVINKDDLSIKLAKEFSNQDALKTWERDHIFLKITSW